MRRPKRLVLMEGILKKAHTPGAVAKELVEEALTHPSIFTFGELLELPVLQQAANEKQVLEVFAYGTWNDYKKAGRAFYLSFLFPFFLFFRLTSFVFCIQVFLHLMR